MACSRCEERRRLIADATRRDGLKGTVKAIRVIGSAAIVSIRKPVVRP